MAGSVNATLGAGTCLSYEDQTVPGTYNEVTQALKIFEVSDNQGNEVDVTPLCNDVGDKETVTAESDAREIEITCNDVPGDAAYEAYVALAMAKTTMNHRIEFSNGRIADFELKLTGFKVADPDRGTQLQGVITAVQTSDIVWTVSP